MKTEVNISKSAEKDLRKLNKDIVTSLQEWISLVEAKGLAEASMVRGYNTEHLKGDRKGERSVRLNKAYRAIFTVENGVVQIVTITEINKHKY